MKRPPFLCGTSSTRQKNNYSRMKNKLILIFMLPVFCILSAQSGTARNNSRVIKFKYVEKTTVISSSANRLTAQGTKIVKPNGEEFIIRSLGLGGWFLQEGYMLGTSGAQWEIRAFLNSIAGVEATNRFYDSWLANFVTEDDIREIASMGYNTIRVPLHYELFFNTTGEWISDSDMNRGMNFLHQVINWATKYNLYVVPDLHAAPGGQGKNKDISDYNSALPGLWESQKNQDMTVLLWGKIAQEFAQNNIIAGYDLINEVNYDFENTGDASGGSCMLNAPLRALYKRIITEIRRYDSNRILFIEGNAYANNFNGLKELFSHDFPNDVNLAFSFHKYWNANNQSSISKFLTLRSTYNRPLWLGETGENSNTWFADMVKLMEQNSIGWSNWPWKKITTFDGPMLVTATPEWTKLMQYKKSNSNPKPTQAEAQKALLDMAECIKMENCTPFPDVSFAYIYASHGITKPYKDVSVSDVINATDFDLGAYNQTWNDVDYINTTGSSKPETYWNKGFAYRNDGVDIYKSTNPLLPNGHYVGDIKDGEWLSYTITVEQAGKYDLTVLVAGFGGVVSAMINGETDVSNYDLPNTNSYSAWTPVKLGTVQLAAGSTQLKLLFNAGNFNLGTIKFEKTTALNSIDTVAPNEKLWSITPTFIKNGDIHFGCKTTSVSEAKIQIYNSQGRMVKSLLYDSAFSLHKSVFQPGSYIATILSSKGFESHRFVVGC